VQVRRVRVGIVAEHHRHAARDLAERHLERSFRVVGQLTTEVRDPPGLVPCLLLVAERRHEVGLRRQTRAGEVQQCAVGRRSAPPPQPHRHVELQRPEVEPAVDAVPVRHEQAGCRGGRAEARAPAAAQAVRGVLHDPVIACASTASSAGRTRSRASSRPVTSEWLSAPIRALMATEWNPCGQVHP
jgi:hypothetical protein